VQTLKIGKLPRVAGANQGIEPGTDERAHPTAEHRLFAKEIRFGLLPKCRFDHPRTGAANRFGPGKRGFLSLPGGVLVDGEETGNAPALDKLATNHRTKPLRRDHDNVQVFRWNNRAVKDREPMGEKQRLAGREGGCDLPLVNRRHPRVREGEKNDITAAGGFGGAHHFQSIFAGDTPRFAPGLKPDYHPHPAVFQIQGMRATLRAIANHRANFPAQEFQVAVSIGINARRHRTRDRSADGTGALSEVNVRYAWLRWRGNQLAAVCARA